MAVVNGTFGKQRGGQELLKMLEDMGVGKEGDASEFVVVVNKGDALAITSNADSVAEVLLMLQQGVSLTVEGSLAPEGEQ